MPNEDEPSWYESPAGDLPLEQGDLIFGLPVYEVESLDLIDAPRVRRRVISGVVLTQTCDIPKKAQESLLIAEVHEYSTIRTKLSNYNSSEFRKQASRGLTISEALLPPADGVMGWSLVVFRHLFTVPKALFTQEILDERRKLRIVSPYKEYLSQYYARFMMRVGLPRTLSDFESAS